MFGKLIIRYNKFGKPAGRHATPVEAKAAAGAAGRRALCQASARIRLARASRR